METAQLSAVVAPSVNSATFTVLGIRVELLLSGADTGGVFSTHKVTMQPGQAIPPHIHQRDDETFTVLSGEFEYVVGGEPIRLGAGQQIFLPRGVSHAIRNIGETAGELLQISTPAGHEHFFADMDAVGAKGPIEMEAVAEVFGRHGMDFAG